MSNRQYYVNNGKDNLGPYDMGAIINLVHDGGLKATDYLYLDDKDEWVMVCQHPEFTNGFTAQKPKKPINERTLITEVTAHEAMHVATEWFVLKNKNRIGPFEIKEVFRMLHDKEVYEFDYVWHHGMENWKRIAEVQDFSAENTKKNASSKSSDVFYRRKHQRSKYDCSVIVHDNTRIWRGESVELSEGGAGILMENSSVAPGQTVFIHFKPGAHSQAFNVTAEIVSKRYPKGNKDDESPVVYGVKFLNIQSQNKEEIRSLKPAA